MKFLNFLLVTFNISFMAFDVILAFVILILCKTTLGVR